MGLTSFMTQRINNWLGGDGKEAPTAPAPAPTKTKTTQPLAPDPAPAPAQNLPVPAPAQTPVDGTITTGTFIPSGANVATDIMMTDAQKHTEHFRQVVETFDEDKQEPVEWAIRQAASFFCYLAPFVVAFFIGMAVGDKFAAGQDGWSIYGIHVLSLCLELVMPVLGIATTISFKRALKDRASVPGLISIGLFFLVISISNALALLTIMEKGANWGNGAEVAAILGRSFGPLVLDVGCTVYLAIANVRSLRKYLADQRKKIEAVRDVNAVNIELEQANMKAALDRVQAISEMQSKQQRMATFNEAERLTHQAVIEAMKQKLITDGSDNGRGRSRYGSW